MEFMEFTKYVPHPENPNSTNPINSRVRKLSDEELQELKCTYIGDVELTELLKLFHQQYTGICLIDDLPHYIPPKDRAFPIDYDQLICRASYVLDELQGGIAFYDLFHDLDIIYLGYPFCVNKDLFCIGVLWVVEDQWFYWHIIDPGHSNRIAGTQPVMMPVGDKVEYTFEFLVLSGFGDVKWERGFINEVLDVLGRDMVF